MAFAQAWDRESSLWASPPLVPLSKLDMLDVQEGKKSHQSRRHQLGGTGPTQVGSAKWEEGVVMGGFGSFNANSVNLALKMVKYPMVQFARWEQEPTLCTCKETCTP